MFWGTARGSRTLLRRLVTPVVGMTLAATAVLLWAPMAIAQDAPDADAEAIGGRGGERGQRCGKLRLYVGKGRIGLEDGAEFQQRARPITHVGRVWRSFASRSAPRSRFRPLTMTRKSSKSAWPSWLAALPSSAWARRPRSS